MENIWYVIAIIISFPISIYIGYKIDKYIEKENQKDDRYNNNN